jgi:hypothetical protein
MDTEHRRLDEVRTKEVPWRKWGPYLSDRQWGTVREDYSEHGDAWDFFTDGPAGTSTIAATRGKSEGEAKR